MIGTTHYALPTELSSKEIGDESHFDA
jgi:hypothetical protein